MRNFDFLFFEEGITLKEAVESQYITFKLMNEIGFWLAINVIESGDQIHHDIKPDNIIFVSGEPMLIDEDRKSEGGKGGEVGRGGEGGLRKNPTLSVYSHPQLGEYWNNKGVDMYSVGLVFYYMYTGRDPEPSKGIKLDFILRSKRIEYLLEGMCCLNIDDQNEYAIKELIFGFNDTITIGSEEELDRFFFEYTCGSIICSQSLYNSEYAINQRDIVAYIISEGFAEMFLTPIEAKRYVIFDDPFDISDLAIDYSSYCLFDIYRSEYVDFDFFVLKLEYMKSLDECNFIHLYYTIDNYLVRFDLLKNFTYDHFNPETINNFKAYFDVNEINYTLYSTSQSKRWENIYGNNIFLFFDIIYTIKISESFGSMRTTFDILSEAFFKVLQCCAPVYSTLYFIYYYNILSVQFATTAIDLFDYVNYCFPDIDLKNHERKNDFILSEIAKDFYKSKTNYLIGIEGDGECRTLKKYTKTMLNIIYDIQKEVSDDEFNRIIGNRRYFDSVVQKMNIMIKPAEICNAELEKYQTELIRLFSFQNPTEHYYDEVLHKVFLRD